MAQCIPDHLPSKASQGEVRLFAILSRLPDDCIVYYEPMVHGRLPDFVVIAPKLGLMVIEVKGWRPSDVLGGDLENVSVINRGVQEQQRHPMRQAREYMFSLMDRCKTHVSFRKLVHDTGCYAGRFRFPFGHFSILSNITQIQVAEARFDPIFPKQQVMTRDVLLDWESKTPEESLAILQSYFDPWWPIVPLQPEQVNTLRAIIHPEVMLMPFMRGMEESLAVKVLDLRQENHARHLGAGHRIVYGVPGSGKTVILVARAKLVSTLNPDKRHLFLCYNIVLANYLRHLLQGCTNVEVQHFDGWSKELSVSRNFREDNDSLGERLLRTLKEKAPQLPKYESVFIDEAQDFAASWFKCVLEQMEDPLDGDVVIVGDGNQGLYRNRAFTWASVGIRAQGRTVNTRFQLDRCYRSTREVVALAQAFAIVGEENAEDSIASMQVSSEQCLRASGFKPVILACETREQESRYAVAIARELMGGKWFGRDIPEPLQSSDIAILYCRANDEESELLLGIEKQLESAIWISRSKARYRLITEPGVKIQTIHSAKGLQYKAVILIWAGQIPSGWVGEDITSERKLLFVGLTRAEEYLTVLYSQPTAFTSEIIATGAAENVASRV